MTSTPHPVRILAAADASWRLASRMPRSELAPYVRDFHGYTEQASTGLRRREMPEGGVVLIVNFGTPWTIADPRHAADPVRRSSFVAGVDDFASIVGATGPAHCLQVNFTPIGARAFFRVPMRDLARQTIPLDALTGRWADTLADRLFQAPDWSSRFDIVEDEVARRVCDSEISSGTQWAWQTVSRLHGQVSIGRLAATLGWSRKHLAAQFSDHVGLPPKAVAGIARFNYAVSLIDSASAGSLASVAHAAGYYDQAHFNRDFLMLAGITPGTYMARRLPQGGGLLA